MSHTIGELVVIALKAENLPSRTSKSPQDPFCVFKLGTVAKKTKIDQRGGRNPIWDDQVNLPVPGGITRLFVQIFNRQTSSENLISEGHVDLHEVLRKGEHDGFFPLVFNGTNAGRIYLELTFYASQVHTQPPPIRYYAANPYPNHRPPPPNVRPPPPNVRPPPPHARPIPQQHFNQPPPPLQSSSNMRPSYPPVQIQQSVSATTHMNPSQGYSNIPPPSHGQPSNFHPPPPARPIRHNSMPGPQPVIASPYHPPPISTPRPANGYSPRPMPPQQQPRPLPLTPQQHRPPYPLPQPQPYYSNQPSPLPPPPQQQPQRIPRPY